MTFYKDIFINYICPYINPLEFHQIRTLSKLYFEWVSIFLMNKYKTCSIQDMICPMCANWFEIKDLSMINDFYDIYLLPRVEVSRHIYLSNFFNYKRKKGHRMRLLCEDCDYNDIYDTKTRKRLPYKGTRFYNEMFITNDYYPWAFLYIENKENDTILWNEYRIVDLSRYK